MESVYLFALNFIWQIAALALLALGLAMVFGQLKIMNMAHGEFVMMGAYSWVLVAQMGWPPVLAVPVCVLGCLLYTSPSPRDRTRSRMPSSA